ncbi:hypothetical protein LTS08_001829 [Lithohypha guttulata]|nr:hypothetical protein LTS08_001829 [Lithohypha guttulata]
MSQIEPFTLATIPKEISTFEAAKEAIALKVLLTLQKSEHLDDTNEAGRQLATYRKNLAWTLIQPPGCALRRESWRWIMMIAERFPSVIVTIVQTYIEEAKAIREFLKQEHVKQVEAWMVTLFEETSAGNSSLSWMATGWAATSRVQDAASAMLHHCAILKFLEKMLAGWHEGNEEARQAVRTL